jgi:hypothetical protein
MKLKEIVLKLQTPGRGSPYQDEKMLQDFIDDSVATATEDLRRRNAELVREVSQLQKQLHRLTDQLEDAKKKK